MLESIILASVLNDISTSWEDPATSGYFGTYGNVGEVDYSDAEAYSGSYSLSITEEPSGGTPQVFVAFVTGLKAGDTVSASAFFLGLDGNGDGGYSGGRLWGHYSSGDTLDTYDYIGSAINDRTSDNGIVGRSSGSWELSEIEWTVAEGQTSIMIEARIYAYDGGADNQVWIDNLIVSSSNTNASIVVGGVSDVAIPAPGALALLGLAGLGRRRRNV